MLTEFEPGKQDKNLTQQHASRPGKNKWGAPGIGMHDPVQADRWRLLVVCLRAGWYCISPCNTDSFCVPLQSQADLLLQTTTTTMVVSLHSPIFRRLQG